MTEPAKAVAKPRAVKEVKEPPPEPAKKEEVVLSAGQLRAYRSRKIGIRFLIFVGLPTLIACVYYLAIATPLYDARAVVAVQSTNPEADAAATKTATTMHQRDARLLADRARSSETRHGLKDLVEVDATVDTSSSAVTVRVRARSAARAATLARDVVARLTTWVEEQSQRARQERIAPAERDVADAKAHLAKLQGVDPTQGGHDLASDLETAQLELEAATDGLKHARLEAGHAQLYLVTIDEARADGGQAWPRPLWNIATVMVCAMVLVAVLSLLGAAVREHANF